MAYEYVEKADLIKGYQNAKKKKKKMGVTTPNLGKIELKFGNKMLLIHSLYLKALIELWLLNYL